MQQTIAETDPTAWPSTYYGRTRRIDLAKFYQDVLLASEQPREPLKKKSSIKRRPTNGRRVSFATGPPIVHEYEAENDLTDLVCTPMLECWPRNYQEFKEQMQKDTLASLLVDSPALCDTPSPRRRSRRPHKLDLRPIRNTNYVPKEQREEQVSPSPTTTSPIQIPPALVVPSPTSSTESIESPITPSDKKPSIPIAPARTRKIPSSESPPLSPVQGQQHKLLNRVSLFFQQNRKRRSEDEQEGGTSAAISSASMETETLIDDTSRVDSMFSAQSQHSVRPNHTPPPLRTVRLDNPIVHQSPPTPTAARSVSPRTPPTPDEDVDQAFERLLKEYALPTNLRPTLSGLTTEQKAVLLQSSQSRMFLRKNSSFSLAASLGIQRKSRGSVRDRMFFISPSEVNSTASQSHPATTSSSANEQQPPRRSRHRRRSSLLTGTSDSYRSKTKASPEYFVHMIRETPVRQLEETDITDLRVFLRNVVASWTTEFLSSGGYEAISDLFRQMKQLPKRMPQDDKTLQHLAKCFKAIMTHEQGGTNRVLRNPVGLEHIRDLLFLPTAQKGLYGLDITTRALLLNILCTLTGLQTTSEDGGEYVHGYNVLRNLLMDRPSDLIETKEDLPFRISLKVDPQQMMKIIDTQSEKPRYTAWMREIHRTVEKHIEHITLWAGVLGYKFESAFRQLKLNQNDDNEDDKKDEGTGLVMVDEGVVDYLITHLRLIRTIIATPPTTYQGTYDAQEQEKVRLEIMLSGFDKISKSLRSCPHPTLYASYIRYLQPLLHPWAELTPPGTVNARTLKSPVHNSSDIDHNGQWIRNREADILQWKDEVSTSILQEAPPWISDDDDDFTDDEFSEKQMLANLENFDDIFDDEEDEDDENDDIEEPMVLYDEGGNKRTNGLYQKEQWKIASQSS
ncbi:hypothetical protein EC973_000892 [Apophysomyces ossiformis]|uniref:Formin GTPase-binding domain-containing protein n=1 Tax=Apophysomyces ossiformis TaxID=679940 RepID=A0A8H7EPQ3_9FUNG|nr:hypothetical protein EC973_000892 [Apophysomyces ossiformis]